MAGPVVVDGRVMLRDEQGAAFSVPEAEAAQQLQSGGFRLESPDEYHQRQVAKERGTLGQQAITVAEGGLRGATFGLGTAALAELGGEDYRQAARERAETNPNSAMAGELVGAIAPALASGGQSLVARGVGAVGAPARLAGRAGTAAERLAGNTLKALGVEGETLLSRAASQAIQKGAAGAVEGGAYGLGSSLADSALEGTDWTVDRALAGMKDGALYGFAGGAVAGAGGEVLKSAGKQVVKSMFGEGKTLRQGISEFADKRVVKSAVGNDIATFRKLTNNGEDMTKLGRVAEKMRKRRFTGLATDAEKTAAVKGWADEASDNLTKIAKGLDDSNVRPDLEPIQDAIRDQVSRLRETGSVEHARVAKQIERQADKILNPIKYKVARNGVVETVTRAPTFTELRKFKSALGEVTKWHRDTKSLATAEFEKLYGTVAKSLDGAADVAGDDIGKAWRAANEDAFDALTLKKGLEREQQRKVKNRFISPSDYGAGGLAGNLIGTLTGLATGSIGLGSLTGLITGAATSAAHKFVRERGSAVVAQLADHAADAVLRTKSAARSLAGVGKAPARAAAVYGTTEARKENYEKVRAFIETAQQHPSVLAQHIERVTAPYARSQPEVAFAMGKRIAEDHAWLRTKVPVPMSRAGHSLTPMHEKSVVPKRDQIKLVRYAQALADPVGVLEDAASGSVNWDGIEAIKARRPELWQDMRVEVAKACAENEAEIPRRRRILLSLAFDFDGDRSLSLMKDVQAINGAPQGAPGSGLKPQSSVGAVKSENHGTAYQSALEGAAA